MNSILLIDDQPKKIALPSQFFKLYCDCLITISFKLIQSRAIKKHFFFNPQSIQNSVKS
jgi:hypothetical protein